MSVHIRAKDIALSDNLKEHIDNAINHFRKFHLDIISYNVNIQKENKEVSVEFDINIAHANPVIINQSDENLDIAIDIAIQRTTNALSRLHERATEHKSQSLKNLEVEEA